MPSSPNYKRDYKQEYVTQKNRGEHEDRMERQRARNKLDAAGVDRSGKDISHKVPLRSGGDNADGFKLESRSKNRSRNGHKPGEKM